MFWSRRSLDIQYSEAILLFAFFWFSFLRDVSSYVRLIWAVELDLTLWSTFVRLFWLRFWSLEGSWGPYWQYVISKSVAIIRWIWGNLLQSDNFLETLGSCVLLLRYSWRLDISGAIGHAWLSFLFFFFVLILKDYISKVWSITPHSYISLICLCGRLNGMIFCQWHLVVRVIYLNTSNIVIRLLMLSFNRLLAKLYFLRVPLDFPRWFVTLLADFLLLLFLFFFIHVDHVLEILH